MFRDYALTLDCVSLVVATAAVLLQAILGLFIRPKSHKQKKCYKISFSVIAILGFVAVLWSGIRTIEYQTKIDTNIGKIQTGQEALPNRVIVLMAKLLGVPASSGKYPETVLEAISSKIKDLQTRQIFPPIIVKGGATYDIPNVSAIIDVQSVAGKTTVVRLPRSPYIGERLDIKNSGDQRSSTMNILIVRGNGKTIDGSSDYQMNLNNESITVTFDGKRWILS